MGGSNTGSSNQINKSTSNSPSQEPSTPKEEPKQVLQSHNSNLPSETSELKPAATPKAPAPKAPAPKQIRQVQVFFITILKNKLQNGYQQK